MSKNSSQHKQIPLGFSVRPHQNLDTVLIGAPNADAVEWLNYWPNWQGRARALTIFGPAGSGKSLLGRYFADMHDVVYLTEFRSFSTADFQSPHIVLDGLDISDQWDEEALFHLYNWIASQNGTLLLLSRLPASQLNWSLPDLASRLSTSAMQEIFLPDDAFLSEYLQQLFIQRQYSVSDAVLQYVVQRMPRSFGFALELVDALDKASMSLQKPMSVMIAKSVLEELGIDSL